MNVYTYFSEVPGISLFDSVKLILLWMERWRAVGMEPRVLSEWHARQHPYFEEFDAAIRKIPTANAPEYERACFIRWLALAQVGGGFLSDYDVFSKRLGELKQCQLPWPMSGADLNKLHILQANCVCPCLAYAYKSVAERLCEEFATGTFTMHEINGQKHLSDQYAIEQLVLAKADWIKQHDYVKLYGDEGWEKSPFVHFANASFKDHNQPRWKRIPELLK